MRKIVSVFAVAAALLTIGCASIGPANVTRDRFDYVTAISESWKRQMLLNLLKVRCCSTPARRNPGTLAPMPCILQCMTCT